MGTEKEVGIMHGFQVTVLLLVVMTCVLSSRDDYTARCTQDLQDCYKKMPESGPARKSATKACQKVWYACIEEGRSNERNNNNNDNNRENNSHNNYDNDGETDRTDSDFE